MQFTDYPFMPGIYDMLAPELLLKTGRQVGKSTMNAVLIITDSISIPHFKTLFVSPSREQTSKFSNTRLSKMINYSPLIRRVFVDPARSNSVLLQILRNGSEIALSYARDDPDRIRSITADREFIDEVQDIEYDAVIPVVKECMSNSDHYHITYTGTPKTMENSIEFLWQRSSKNEWIMKCEGCGSWQFVDNEKSIGKRGIMCVKCGHSLEPRDGRWYSFNPKARIKGFHIPQPILPKNNEDDRRWYRILDKLQNYSPTKFRNEVLGVSDAVGSRYITQEELLELCDDYFVDMPVSQRLMEGTRVVVAGVDWGGGSSSSEVVSRTVLWVYGLTQDYRLKTLYFKIFPEDNPSANVHEIAHILKSVGCQYVVGDAGGGAIANSELSNALGGHRVGQSQYGGGNGYGQLIRWSEQAQRYLVNRTAAIDSYMLALKNKEVIYPNARQSAEAIQDVLNEYEDMVRAGAGENMRKAWRHAPTAPDDALHAQIYAWLALKVVQGVVEFYEDREDL